jgi:hypothetical protein
LNAPVPYGLLLSHASSMSSLLGTGSGEAETSVLGRGALGRGEDPSENTPYPRAGSVEAELW